MADPVFVQATRAPRSRSRLLAWTVAIVLALAAFVNFVVRPLAERAVTGVMFVAGSVISGAATAVAVAVEQVYAQACDQIKDSDQIRALVGQPIVFPPIEQVQFVASGDPDVLEFTFQFAGQTAPAEARASAATRDNRFEIVRLEVTAVGQSIELERP